jgi:hypothetical protein
MILQILSIILDKYEPQLGSTNTEQFELLKGLRVDNQENISEFTK